MHWNLILSYIAMTNSDSSVVFCVIGNFTITITITITVTITRDRAWLGTFFDVVIVIVRDWELFPSSWSWSCVIRHFLRDRDRDRDRDWSKNFVNIIIACMFKTLTIYSETSYSHFTNRSRDRGRAWLGTFSVVVIVIVCDWELFRSSWSWSCVIGNFFCRRDRDRAWSDIFFVIVIVIVTKNISHAKH
jgi:hypothetical protein